MDEGRKEGLLKAQEILEREGMDLITSTFDSSVAAVQSCFCFIIVAAAIVLGIGALFLLFVLLYSQRVASQSCETLGELLHHPHLIGNQVIWVFCGQKPTCSTRIILSLFKTPFYKSEKLCNHR